MKFETGKNYNVYLDITPLGQNETILGGKGKVRKMLEDGCIVLDIFRNTYEECTIAAPIEYNDEGDEIITIFLGNILISIFSYDFN